MKTIKVGLSLASIMLAISACTTSSPSNEVVSFKFTEASSDIISLEDRSRRKWDSAVIADLDQDGYQDMLLTDHSDQVNLYWNNQGVFAKPVILLGGDTHGIAASDIDNDGLVEIIVSMGGGGGKKPRYPKVFEVAQNRAISKGEIFPLYQRTRGRAVKFLDADQDGDSEVVFSAFPLKSQKKGANYLYNNEQNELKFDSILPQAKWLGYKTTVTDVNTDGDADIIFHGGDNVVVAQGGKGLSFKNNSEHVLGEIANTKKVSGITEIDFDNDGDMDLFLSRAKHQFEEERFYDAENQRFAFFARRQQFQFDDLVITGDFILENLQMAYPHFDVFVGAEKRLITFDVDQHGGKNLTLTQQQGQGWPKDRKAKGLYIGHLGNGVWRIAGETSSPTAGVVHNVTSSPSVTSPDKLPAKLLENRNGKFVDVTELLNININEQTSSAVAGDFNNDGWNDLFVVRVGSMASENEQILLENQGGKAFKTVKLHGVVSKELGATGGGAEVLDYDLDGDLDLIYANERGKWHLFTNQLSHPNNYLRVTVAKSPAQKVTSLSAKLSLTACGNTYIRTVGGNSSPFSHGANNQLHVGLGQCASVDSAEIQWTNGEKIALPVTQLNRNYDAGGR